MKSCLIFLVFALVLSLNSGPARAIVYVNMQWNEHLEEWEPRPLILEGEGLSLNRDYQNAYGYSMDLPPGPPFIFTNSIIVNNIFDEYDEVTDWGSLTVTTAGEGTEPFVLEFHPPVFPSPADVSSLSFRGHVSIEGTSSDPIIFRGTFGINNPMWDLFDPEPDRARLHLIHCVFDHVGYDGTCSSILIHIKSADVVLDNCIFSNFLPNAINTIIDFEEDSSFRPPTWQFTMRECRFSNIMLDGAPPIVLSGLGEVNIERNDFTGVLFDDSSWNDGVLINLRGFGAGKIRGNTGSGNTNSAFWIRGIQTADGAMTLGSSHELPFLVGQITVGDDRTLTIEEGSVLKMNELMTEANFRVYGHMVADGVVFTSWEDDSIGGDNDLQPEPPAIGYWGSTNEGGILVGQDATLELDNSTIRYARSGVKAQGDAIVNNCTFQLNEYSGFVGGGGIDGHYEITNSTFENNGNNGISLSNTGLHQTMIVDNVRSINNSRGLHISGLETNPADITVSRSVFAGNIKAAVKIYVGPGLETCTMTGCIISGNFSAGISTLDYDGDDAILRFESCVIAGNGYDYFTQEGVHGAGINGGRPLFINNTVAWNKGAGYYHVPPHPYGGDEDVANNIIMHNLDYGYTNYVELPSRFSHNLFWENEDGELRIDADEGDFRSVEDLEVLGGDYATNIDADPELVAGVEGAVDSVRYLEVDNLSYLFSHDASDDGRDLSDLIVRPDIHEEPWHFITRHSGDTLVIVGDITGIAAPGDTFNIFDHHLDWASAIVDAGNTALPTEPLDIDGEHRIIDGDGSTLADVDIGADEFGADSMTLVLLTPVQDDFWVSGDERYIMWSAVGVDSVNLYYQVHYGSGGGYDSIVAGLPASGGRYEWIVPDTLSARCRVMITDHADTTHDDESELFTIRSRTLARFGPGGEFEAYRPGKDGWRIPNNEPAMWPEDWWSRFDYLTGTDPYTGEPYPAEWSEFGLFHAQPDDFPDWPLFVEAFGPDQCYIDTPEGPVYRPAAVWRWSRIKGEWGGSCFGFSTTSFQAFDDKTTFLVTFPDVDNFDSLYALLQMEDYRHRKTINTVMIRQYGDAAQDYLYDNYNNAIDKTFYDLKEMLLDETRDDRILALIRGNGAGGHVVNPYRIRRDETDPDVEWIYVYDSNVPGDSTARIRVDTETGIYTYNRLPHWGYCNRIFLLDPASTYYSTPALGSAAPAAGRRSLRSPLNGVYQQFYNTPGIAITISDDSGHAIGFADSVVFNSVPDAVPMISLEADYSPPIGYVAPAGDYAVEMTRFPDSIATFSLAADSLIFSYMRSNAESLETDHIMCSDGFKISNYDNSSKTIGTQAIVIGTGEERVFDLRDIGLSQNDSIQLEVPGRDVCIASNFGDAKGYNIGIRRVSGAGMAVFEHDGITLPAGTAHQIVPDWGNLETVPLKIYIDTGNDGSVDDSMFVENEYVATLLQQFSAVYRGTSIEIRWRLSEIDEGVEFELLRAAGGRDQFDVMHEGIVAGSGLSYSLCDYSIEHGESYRYRVIYSKDGERRVLFETQEIVIPAIPLTLYQNYPNPFNPVTRIRYYLPEAAHVRLDVYDVAGRRINSLVNGRKKKGHHFIDWKGENSAGSRVSSGIYFYRLTAGKKRLSHKMILLR